MGILGPGLAMGILGPGMARGILVRAQVGYGYTGAWDG